MTRLKYCKKFSCGVDILSALDGRDAHPTRVKLMHYFKLVTPVGCVSDSVTYHSEGFGVLRLTPNTTPVHSSRETRPRDWLPYRYLDFFSKSNMISISENSNFRWKVSKKSLKSRFSYRLTVFYEWLVSVVYYFSAMTNLT